MLLVVQFLLVLRLQLVIPLSVMRDIVVQLLDLFQMDFCLLLQLGNLSLEILFLLEYSFFLSFEHARFKLVELDLQPGPRALPNARPQRRLVLQLH